MPDDFILRCLFLNSAHTLSCLYTDFLFFPQVHPEVQSPYRKNQANISVTSSIPVSLPSYSSSFPGRFLFTFLLVASTTTILRFRCALFPLALSRAGKAKKTYSVTPSIQRYCRWNTRREPAVFCGIKLEKGSSFTKMKCSQTPVTEIFSDFTCSYLFYRSYN